MSKLLLKQILSGKPEPIRPIAATERRGPKNPFLPGNSNNPALAQEVGVNMPLRHPLFVGYRDNKPIYAGSRLFVLY